jgi:hypothetical protein
LETGELEARKKPEKDINHHHSTPIKSPAVFPAKREGDIEGLPSLKEMEWA